MSSSIIWDDGASEMPCIATYLASRSNGSIVKNAAYGHALTYRSGKDKNKSSSTLHEFAKEIKVRGSGVKSGVCICLIGTQDIPDDVTKRKEAKSGLEAILDIKKSVAVYHECTYNWDGPPIQSPESLDQVVNSIILWLKHRNVSADV
jgi:hypothetical protein